MTPAEVAAQFPALTNAQCAKIGTLLSLTSLAEAES